MNEVTVYSEKEHLIQHMEREFATTIKVLRSYPDEKLDLKPAEKSRTARDLVWTFVLDQGITEKIISGNMDLSGETPQPVGNLDQMINTCIKMFNENLSKIKDMTDSDLNSTIKWFVGPGQMVDMRKIDVLEIFLFDMIHHRGQFSVYLRIAGGKVPSIYGPTADEEWFK